MRRRKHRLAIRIQPGFTALWAGPCQPAKRHRLTIGIQPGFTALWAERSQPSNRQARKHVHHLAIGIQPDPGLMRSRRSRAYPSAVGRAKTLRLISFLMRAGKHTHRLPSLHPAPSVATLTRLACGARRRMKRCQATFLLRPLVPLNHQTVTHMF